MEQIVAEPADFRRYFGVEDREAKRLADKFAVGCTDEYDVSGWPVRDVEIVGQALPRRPRARQQRRAGGSARRSAKANADPEPEPPQALSDAEKRFIEYLVQGAVTEWARN